MEGAGGHPDAAAEAGWGCLVKRVPFCLSAVAAIGALGGPLTMPQSIGGRWYQADLRRWHRRRDRNGKRRRRGSRP
jgi:hypothetical protein